jgi:hypothetical protein
MLFTGVSLWVFFILINNTTSSASIMSTTWCNFTLDGNDVGTFAHWVDYEATWTVQYNATVFSVSGLSNSLHEFIISTSDGQVGSYIIFDYAIYTYVYAIIAPSSCGSNVILGLMSPIILRPRQFQDPCPLCRQF